MMGLSKDDSGSLPQGDRNKELEKLSLIAFQRALGPFVDKLWFREEPVDDTGVDGSLEVKNGGCHTNLRSQVQMKSTENPKFLKDGTATKQVDSSNLNYLLNGPSPMYVMYILPTEELRYAWARDECKRIEQSNPDWLQQGSVSLHFKEVITLESLDSIRDRIIAEGKFERQIHELIVRKSAAKKTTITIDPSSLEIADPNRIEELLLGSGFSLINSGQPKKVVELANQLPQTTRDKAGVRVVLAYGDYMMGRYDGALGQIVEAMLNAQELTATEQAFLSHLRLLCDYHRGHITSKMLAVQQQALADADTGAFKYYYLVEGLRQQLMTEGDQQRWLVLLDELREVCLRIESAEDAGKYDKIQARLTMLLFEGTQKLMSLNREMAWLKIRSMIPAFSESDSAEVKLADQALVAWEESVQRMMSEALELGDPILVTEAIFVKLEVQFQALFAPFAQATIAGRAFTISSGVLGVMEREWKGALHVFHEAGILDRELQMKMLVANIYEIVGLDEEAMRIASEVRPIAHIMGYTKIEELASQTMEQRSVVQEFRTALRATFSDEDHRVAEMTDEEAKRLAAHTLTELGLADSRLGAVERDCIVTREAARQRISWCRYIGILDHTGHQQSVDTLYAQDPDRKCVCTKHAHETQIETPHWEGLLASFKQHYCELCPDRNPKKDGRTW